jgi:excisionase family DNA binding protein
MNRHPAEMLDGGAIQRVRPITVRIKEACRITGIGRSKFYELIKAGDIETVKVGSLTLVPMANIEAFLACLKPKSGE